jgi:outer membrane biosynthesis protein TonB
MALVLASTGFGQEANDMKEGPKPVVEFQITHVVPRVEQAPVLKTPVSVWVHFPMILRRAGIEEGRVKARLTIEPDGTVSRLTLVAASQHEFAESVFKGGKKCTYTPAKSGGRAIRCEVEADFMFRLE